MTGLENEIAAGIKIRPRPPQDDNEILAPSQSNQRLLVQTPNKTLQTSTINRSTSLT